jgi:potassium intermediate/small conductance calcium-activated channel subfamily N member 3
MILIELIICAIHPLPIQYSFTWTTHSTLNDEILTARVPIDLVLSLPMFLRLYLLCRIILLHSNIFTDPSGASVRAFNRIKLNTQFMIKTTMDLFPGTVIFVILFSIFVISSWIFRACEK